MHGYLTTIAAPPQLPAVNERFACQQCGHWWCVMATATENISLMEIEESRFLSGEMPFCSRCATNDQRVSGVRFESYAEMANEQFRSLTSLVFDKMRLAAENKQLRAALREALDMWKLRSDAEIGNEDDDPRIAELRKLVE